jgi:pimeloyl-ACP methyl ester carboxylesterase
MQDTVSRRNVCVEPPLQSVVIDKCGDKCISAVTIVHDMSSDMFGRSNLIEKLEKDHRLLLFQNRGHYNISRDDLGHVSKEGDPDAMSLAVPGYIPDPVKCKELGVDPYTFELFSDDVVRMMDKHGIEKTDVVGFSLGSFVAQALAARHPERVGKMAIGKAFSKYSDIIVAGKDLIRGPVLTTGYWLWCNLRQRVYKERDYGCSVPMAVVDDIAANIVDTDMKKYQIDVKAPTLVIHCPDDDLFGSPVDSIPTATRKNMTFCGHLFNMRNDAMYDAISDFLKKRD